MDHVVYVDAKASELPAILTGEKTMIIRGAAGRKMHYGRVQADDVLYLIENDGSGLIRARARTAAVTNSERMTPEESAALVDEHQGQLQLSAKQVKRWVGKRYLVLIEIDNAIELEPFRVDRSDYGNMDDWLPVGDIDSVRVGE